MCHKSVLKRTQTGSALIMAVFVIVFMAILVVAIPRNISSSSEQNIYEVLGTRALLAAETGNELALTQLFPLGGGAGNCISQQRYFDVNNVQIAGLENCTVNTTCTTIPDNGNNYFRITSKGTCKNSILGSNNNIHTADRNCANTDLVCATRTITVEARDTTIF